MVVDVSKIKYYKDQLELLGNPYVTDMEETAKVCKDLLKKMSNDCNSLSFSEKDWICNNIQILHDKNDKLLDPYDFPCCEDSIFYIRYPLYFNNVDGHYPALDWTGKIEGVKKDRDLQMLNQNFKNWNDTISITNHKDPLLNYVSKETRHQIKEIERYCKNEYLGLNKKQYLIKSIVLNTKYLFRYVQKFYEENPEKIINIIDEKETSIDAFAYIHIMSRHYGQMIKEHQIGKSYHVEGLDYKNMPMELSRILIGYGKISSGKFDGQKIYFLINGKPYGIWFKQIKSNIKGGGVKIEYRVQTFYPVEDINELKKLKQNFPNQTESNGIIYLTN